MKRFLPIVAIVVIAASCSEAATSTTPTTGAPDGETGDGGLAEADGGSTADATTGADGATGVDGATAPDAVSEDATASDANDASANDGAADAALDGPAGCVAGGACSDNAGFPCREGVVACVDGGPTCVDGAAATEGTPCTSGLCGSGSCRPSVTVSNSWNPSFASVVPGRTCSDAMSFAVTGLTTTSATVSTSSDGTQLSAGASCLSQGDEVLLINLQGSIGEVANVGNWELLQVASYSVPSKTVTFATAKTRNYGAGNDDTRIGPTGVSGKTQRVMLMRVPRFGVLTVTNTGTVATQPWEALMGIGGVTALRAVKLTVDGTISADARGYRDGRGSVDRSCVYNVPTMRGESIGGFAAVGGGGAPIGGSSGWVMNDPSPPTSFAGDDLPLMPGAAHAQAGEAGKNPLGRTFGADGTTYGVSDATKLTMGSGAGGGLACGASFADQPILDPFVLASRSGGITLLLVGELTVGATGKISASGAATAAKPASGGYVFIKGGALNVGTGQVKAVGGTATGTAGAFKDEVVKGGDGYVVLQGTSVTGTTSPAANQL